MWDGDLIERWEYKILFIKVLVDLDILNFVLEMTTTPMHWGPMSREKSNKRVTLTSLQSTTKEYKDIEAAYRTTVSGTTIQRVTYL